MSITKPRGTQDIFYKNADYFNTITTTVKIISKMFNFKEIITPIFESKELYVRNIGETSDIVTKEFYDFKDKGNRDLVLRPEGTVGVIRSIVENKLALSNPLPLKFYYLGPMFRYERPQSGRNRQFYQFGVEQIGIKNPYEQVDIILFAQTILESLKISKYTLKINYIGSINTRSKWIDELNKYFSKYKDELTEDSKNRINKNPLRILDDKVDGKKEFVKKAPTIDAFLTQEEKDEFDAITTLLNTMDIKYTLDKTMVRGLDYYSGLVFEFVSELEILSGQSTIIGGGKYSNLVKEIGGPDIECIGFAVGMERLMICMENENPLEDINNVNVYIASIGKKTKTPSLIIANLLRRSGISVEYNNSLEKLDKHFKLAQKNNANIIAILGDKELEENKIILKNQINKKEISVPIDNILEEIKKILMEK